MYCDDVIRFRSKVTSMVEKVKQYLFPKMDPDVERDMDRETLGNIHRLSIVVTIFECFILLVFIFTSKEHGRSFWVSVWSVLFLIFTCICGFFCVKIMLIKEKLVPHIHVMAFKMVYSIILSVWAIIVSYRNYAHGEQLITFFAVQLMLVCFVPVSPVINIVITVLIYGILLAVMYSIDGAKGINFFNYLVLILVSSAGMLVRFHSQRRMAEKTVQLERNNDLLEYVNRHDSLTGLYSRMAFREDIPAFFGKTLKVFMIDINYFKEINDTFGHAVGDLVLKETSKRLKTLFPGSKCYRYGGDEFLVINLEGDPYMEDTYTFTVPEVTDREILLSIGFFEMTPNSNEQLDELIASADAVLYQVKKRTHSREYGGHDRRH